MLIDKKRYDVLPCPFCGSDKIMMATDYNPPLMRMYVAKAAALEKNL